ncbi:MAG: retroviral-like aspartic protease family protein [Deltaproteobacteria bacterium]|nr:retroviral-like aspartic protease family protein [Deltaproteobacteria bacterium]
MKQFHLDLQSQIILVPAVIVGPKNAHTINLILDTGATFTLIAPEILLRIGSDPSKATDKSAITTASGIEFVPFLKVPIIKTLGVERNDIEVCAHSLPSNMPARGLLGLNFLRHFNIHLDFLKQRMEIFPG